MGRSFWCILMAFMYIIWGLHDHFRKLIDSSEDERKSRATLLKIFKQLTDPPSCTVTSRGPLFLGPILTKTVKSQKLIIFKFHYSSELIK